MSPGPGRPHPAPPRLPPAASCPLPLLPAGLPRDGQAGRCLSSEAARFVGARLLPPSSPPGPDLQANQAGLGSCTCGGLRCSYLSAWGPLPLAGCFGAVVPGAWRGVRRDCPVPHRSQGRRGFWVSFSYLRCSVCNKCPIAKVSRPWCVFGGEVFVCVCVCVCSDVRRQHTHTCPAASGQEGAHTLPVQLSFSPVTKLRPQRGPKSPSTDLAASPSPTPVLAVCGPAAPPGPPSRSLPQ